MSNDKIMVNGVTLNYTVRGAGSPLILLHGNGEDHKIFTPLADKLCKHFAVYAIDSRNHGGSSKTTDFSYQTMAKDIYEFIEKLGLKEVSIVGFSDGAIIAVMLDLAYPNTLRKMALLGINLKPSDFKDENLSYLEEEYAKTQDPLVKLMLEEPNIELTDLSRINIPTLVVRAEDELFEDRLYVDIVDTLPNARLLIMKGHDHGSYVVDTDVLYDDLMAFYSSVTSKIYQFNA